MGLLDEWYAPRLTLKTALLVPTAQLFKLVSSSIRPTPSRAHTFGRPIVVVGNLTVGGTGKTPLTLMLAYALRERGWTVGIVSRGYPVSPKTPHFVAPDDDASACGDEPLLYAQSGFAVVVCASRVDAVNALLKTAPSTSVVLADDALQHTALARDFEICVVDGARGFGNGYLLPAGPLREPVSRLQAVDAVVVNGASSLPPLHAAQFEMQVSIDGLRALNGEAVDADTVPGDVALVAGIGNPSKFFAAVRAAFPTLSVGQTVAFTDHHGFSAAELNALIGEAIVMTEKDAVRCAKIAPQVQKPIYYTTTRTAVTPDLVGVIETALESKGYGRKTA